MEYSNENQPGDLPLAIVIEKMAQSPFWKDLAGQLELQRHRFTAADITTAHDTLNVQKTSRLRMKNKDAALRRLRLFLKHINIEPYTNRLNPDSAVAEMIQAMEEDPKLARFAKAFKDDRVDVRLAFGGLHTIRDLLARREQGKKVIAGAYFMGKRMAEQCYAFLDSLGLDNAQGGQLRL